MDTKQLARAAAARSKSSRRRARADAVAPLQRGMLPRLLGYQLRLAQLAVFRDFAQALGDFDLSPGRVGMLVLIEANPGISQSRLAEAVGLDRSTMVPLLDDFERRGLVARRAGSDRRTNGLWLTPAGARRLARMKRRVAEHEDRITAVLSGTERQTLLKLLARLQETGRSPRVP